MTWFLHDDSVGWIIYAALLVVGLAVGCAVVLRHEVSGSGKQAGGPHRMARGASRRTEVGR